MTLQLRFAAESDTGSRLQNQDYAYAGPVPGIEAWTLLAVADGVGGHARGEWASERAMELFKAALSEALATHDPLDALRDALASVNETIKDEAEGLGARGAATTVVAVLFREGQWWWANVGDSRLYIVSGGAPEQVSADHSWVADQVRAGALSPEAARHHPRKNVITRTIGYESGVEVDTGGPLDLRDDEVLVLCSDGLHGPVDDDDIARTVLALDPEPAAAQLVAMANEAGGPDNITVIVARLGNAELEQTESTPGKAAPKENATESPPRLKRRQRWLLGAGAVVVLAAAGAALAVIQLG